MKLQQILEIHQTLQNIIENEIPFLIQMKKNKELYPYSISLKYIENKFSFRGNIHEDKNVIELVIHKNNSHQLMGYSNRKDCIEKENYLIVHCFDNLDNIHHVYFLKKENKEEYIIDNDWEEEDLPF